MYVAFKGRAYIARALSRPFPPTVYILCFLKVFSSSLLPGVVVLSLFLARCREVRMEIDSCVRIELDTDNQRELQFRSAFERSLLWCRAQKVENNIEENTAVSKARSTDERKSS